MGDDIPWFIPTTKKFFPKWVDTEVSFILFISFVDIINWKK